MKYGQFPYISRLFTALFWIMTIWISEEPTTSSSSKDGGIVVLQNLYALPEYMLP
jgi:hypothetical protein